MKPISIVIQLDRHGSGLACLAMLTGIDYAGAADIAYWRGMYGRIVAHGATAEELRRLLADCGVRIKTPYEAISWPSVAVGSLVAVKRRHGHVLHWCILCRHRNRRILLDPAVRYRARPRRRFGRLQPHWAMQIVRLPIAFGRAAGRKGANYG